MTSRLLQRTAAAPGQASGPVAASPWPGLLLAAAFVLGAQAGLRPISDNSTLVHLRTGVNLVAHGLLPRTDPYSFTAGGSPWVVQSWFASALDALAYLGSPHALVLLQALIGGAVAVTTTWAARTASLPRWAGAAALSVGIGWPGWGPRPFMIGLACLGLVVVVVTTGRHPAWLVPILWLWVNTGGTWPLAVAWVAAWTVGDLLDGAPLRAGTARSLAWTLAGSAAGAVNPLTWHLLAFPAVALTDRQAFANINEWRSPGFQDPHLGLTLTCLALALLAVARAGLPWRLALPSLVFLVLGLLAARNLAPLAVALAPALGHALAPGRTDARDLARATRAPSRPRRRSTLVAAATALLLVAGAAGSVTAALRRPALDLHVYPVAATAFLRQSGRLGPAHRIAAMDVVGCYLVWAAPETKVFLDDRYDAYPLPVIQAAHRLLTSPDQAASILDAYRVDTVLWPRSGPLPAELHRLGWTTSYLDPVWTVLERPA